MNHEKNIVKREGFQKNGEEMENEAEETRGGRMKRNRLENQERNEGNVSGRTFFFSLSEVKQEQEKKTWREESLLFFSRPLFSLYKRRLLFLTRHRSF